MSPVPVNSPFVPPVTVTSPVTNSVTTSENANVAVNASVELITDGTPVIATVGTSASQTAVAVVAFGGPVLSPSVAELVSTVTTTFCPPTGVTPSV